MNKRGQADNYISEIAGKNPPEIKRTIPVQVGMRVQEATPYRSVVAKHLKGIAVQMIAKIDEM